MNQSILHYKLVFQSLSLRVRKDRRSVFGNLLPANAFGLAVAESIERTTTTNFHIL